MKKYAYLGLGIIVIFTSAIGSFWHKPAIVICILYIFLTLWYYVTEIKGYNLYRVVNLIKGEK